MIVPKQHVLSMAQLDIAVRQELECLLIEVSELIELRFSPPTLFEHGAARPGTTFGCGIDHAHLHVVPLPTGLNLVTLAETVLGQRFEVRVPSPSQPYLRIRTPGTQDWLSVEPRPGPPRQFFRQIIWHAMAQPSISYDYDESPCEEHVQTTIAELAGE